MEFSAVVVAAGSGTRAGPGGAKQWRALAGKPVARWSVEALRAAGARELVVVVAAGDEAAAASALAGLDWRGATGGASRSASVRAGLAALTADEDAMVLIHDAARPLLRTEHIARLLEALKSAPGAILALPLADTLKRNDGAGAIAETPPRAGLWRAQTPQAFRLGALRAAFAAWPADEEPTDEAIVLKRAGQRVALVPGDPTLVKLTYPEDFSMAERLAGAARVTRIGQGFDADAGLHALTDALLGAIGEGDIGDHFPPTDPKWKDAASDQFLAHAAALVASRGGRVVNVDVTLICERPKIKPHRAAMRQRLAELLGLDIAAVSVKATTTEGMGFTGREEGLAAQAIAAVELPA